MPRTRRYRPQQQTYHGGPVEYIEPSKSSARRRGLKQGNPTEQSGQVRVIVRAGRVVDHKRYNEIAIPATRPVESLVTAGAPGPGVVHPVGAGPSPSAGYTQTVENGAWPPDQGETVAQAG